MGMKFSSCFAFLVESSLLFVMYDSLLYIRKEMVCALPIFIYSPAMLLIDGCTRARVRVCLFSLFQFLTPSLDKYINV